MRDDIRDLFDRITERYETPVQLGSRCETNTFYRVEDLTAEDLEICATYLSERVVNVCQPSLPSLIITLGGSSTGLAEMLSRELAPAGEELEVINSDRIRAGSGNGLGAKLRGADVILVNEVITTARSCLEAHTRITMAGASVVCWAALIDRTFGPGPVTIVATLTGEPVTLLSELP